MHVIAATSGRHSLMLYLIREPMQMLLSDRSPSLVKKYIDLRVLMLGGALVMTACGGGNDSVVATTTPAAPPVTTPVAPPATGPVDPVPLGVPVLSFVPPQESLDLANYTLSSRVNLPVNSAPGTNQIAAEVSAVTYNEASVLRSRFTKHSERLRSAWSRRATEGFALVARSAESPVQHRPESYRA